MASVTVRVPDELKRQMEKVDVNWSDVLRDAIEERLLRMQREAAAKRMDQMAADIHRRTGKYSTMSEEILRWRRLH